jgi:hypothetical protein
MGGVESMERNSPRSTIEELVLAGLRGTAPAVTPIWAGPPWILEDLPKSIKTARILVYSHGIPRKGSTLKSLADNLLKKIVDVRQSEVPLPSSAF